MSSRTFSRHQLLQVEEVAREAGQLLMRSWPGASKAELAIQTKADGSPVTEVDRASSLLIAERMAQIFPEEEVLCEEGREVLKPPHSSWHIDPLDGTAPFINGEDYFAVFIGHRSGEVCDAGVMYYPARDTIYSGALGVGVWRNGVQVSRPAASQLTEGSVVCQFTDRRVPERFLAPRRFETRNLALLALCCGELGGVVAGYSTGSVKMWDVAAALAICAAAGLQLEDLSGASPIISAAEMRVSTLLAAARSDLPVLRSLVCA